MVYMYYGFFLFLLYMTAPLWMFLPVAAGSWWAMRSSFALQKNMRMSLAKLGWYGEKTAEPQEALKKGVSDVWVERRRFDRVATSLKVGYQVLGDGQKKEAVSPSSGAGEASTLDISEGGLSIKSENPLIAGEQVRLFLHFPQSNAPVSLLAEVRSARASFKLGKTTYKAGLKILDLGLEDMVQLTDYLFNERP